MKEKIFPLSMIFLLLLPMPVLATSVYTQYVGEGSLYLQTAIYSSVKPQITSIADLGAGSCCNCETCEGCDCEGDDYSGYQYVANNPYSWSSDYAEVEDGCINLHQEIIDYKDDEDQLITTNIYTGVEGTGNATAVTAGIPLNVYTYQYAIGSGSTWAYFNQLSEISGDFDFEIIFTGGTYDCEYGYVIMEGEYSVFNSPVLFDPATMEIVCLDPGYSYATLYGSATDILNVNGSVELGYATWFVQAGVEGSGEFIVDIDSDNELVFDFDMVLG